MKRPMRGPAQVHPNLSKRCSVPPSVTFAAFGKEYRIFRCPVRYYFVACRRKHHVHVRYGTCGHFAMHISVRSKRIIIFLS